MSCASVMLVKPPEIWAPVRPSIPSGFWAKLMIGRVLTSLSSTTAKWPESASASSSETPPIAAAWPRWAICRVTSWKASRPLSVNWKVTLGWPSSSVSCFGLVMSVPESAGLSLSAYQPAFSIPSTTLPLLSEGCSETTIVPAGTLITVPLCDRFLPVALMKRSSSENSGPPISSCLASLANR